VRDFYYLYPACIAAAIGLFLLWAGSLFGILFIVVALGLILLDV
jgi:hypothetical protein